MPTPAFVAAWARRPWRLDPLTALAAVLPDGSLDMSEHTAAVDRLLGEDWPDDPLWVCAVRQRDLRRVVFGRDALVPLSAAVRASCSVPGFFRPVDIGDDTFVDGGVRSPTNADVLRNQDLDLVIIVSPMSGRDLGRTGVGNLIRQRARRQVEAERSRLERAGIPSVLIEPGPDVVSASGADFMSAARVVDIVQAAFLDTGDQLRAPFTRTMLAGLNGRRPAVRPARHRVSARRPGAALQPAR